MAVSTQSQPGKARSGRVSRVRFQLAAVLAAPDRAVLLRYSAFQSPGDRSAGRPVYVRQPAAGRALRRFRYLRLAISQDRGDGSKPARFAGAGKYSPRDVVSEPAL